MHQALIVDDDRIVLESMQALLEDHPQVDVCGSAATAEEALVLIDQLQPDFLLLDIHLPGMDGFDLVEKLPYRIPIIFVTTSEAHAVRAFEWNALDYLVKPVEPARLERSIERLLSREEDAAEYSYSGERGKFQDYIYLPMACSQRFIRADDILLLQSHRNNSKIILSDGRVFEIRRSLNEWEQRLDHDHFFRISREVILHTGKIQEVVQEAGEVVCRDERSASHRVSRRRVAGLRKLLTREPEL